jgi:hypothetical protein
MRMGAAAFCMLAAPALLAFGWFCGSHAQETKDPAEALIWSQEQKIYEGRAHGSIQYYVDHADPHYLAWPAGVEHPLNYDTLKKGQKAVAGAHEVIKGEVTGFARDGDTAVIYYLNHRTMRADGTKVDEWYPNIHVWVERDGKWLVLGGMSRLYPPQGK